MAHYGGDLRVILDFCKDAFADYRMCFHLPALLEGQRTRFLKKAGRQANLADVMHNPTYVGETLLLLAKTESCSNVSCVDSDSCRVSRRVAISSVERRNERRRER